MSFLNNLFGKVTSVVYETSSDGSIVKKVHDPKTDKMVIPMEVIGFPEGDSILSKIPIIRMVQKRIIAKEYKSVLPPVNINSRNDPTSPDYQYQVNYDGDNNGWGIE